MSSKRPQFSKCLLSVFLGLLPAVVALGQGPSTLAQEGSSLYPQRPEDPRAVYLAQPAFQVHADGIGDDAVPLQQAIDKVREGQGGGIVFIPEG